MCESDICWIKIYHWITLHYILWLWIHGLYDSFGLFDYCTRWVICFWIPSVHFYFCYFWTIFNLIKLLLRIHMVSLITVLNGRVEQLMIFSIFWILAHLFCLLIELNDLFINLSVLIHLVCLVTIPDGFISSDNLFCIVCLFIQIWYVSLQYWIWSMFR